MISRARRGSGQERTIRFPGLVLTVHTSRYANFIRKLCFGTGHTHKSPCISSLFIGACIHPTVCNLITNRTKAPTTTSQDMRQFSAAVVIASFHSRLTLCQNSLPLPTHQMSDTRFAQFYLFIEANCQQRARAKSTIITMSIGHFVRAISIRHRNVSN